MNREGPLAAAAVVVAATVVVAVLVLVAAAAAVCDEARVASVILVFVEPDQVRHGVGAVDSGAPAAAAVHLIVDGVEQVRGSRVVDPAVRQAATVWTSAAAREVQIEDTGLVAVVARTRNLQVGGCGEAARLAVGGCSRRTSRMRSFCWSRVIVVT